MSVRTAEVCKKLQNPAKEGIKNYHASACRTCDRLNAEFEGLERLYGKAILAMAGEMAPSPEYRRLRRIADEKRIDSEMARLQLKLHRQIHAKKTSPALE